MSLELLTTTRHVAVRRILAAGVVSAIVVAATIYSLKAAGNASAIIRWRDLIQSLARGENVYNEWTKDGSFPNPPIAGLVLWPLTLFPPVAAGLIWFALKVLLAAVSIRWSIQMATGGERDERRETKDEAQETRHEQDHHSPGSAVFRLSSLVFRLFPLSSFVSRLSRCGLETKDEGDHHSPGSAVFRLSSFVFRLFPLPALALLLLLVCRPLLSDLQHGNINILILFLITAGLRAFGASRDWLAGLLIALASAFKLTPALFIPYFAYKRQWRLVGWSLAGLALFSFVVPGAVLGFERNWWLLKSWSGAMVEPYLVDGKVETEQTNQSLPGVWFRLVTDSPGLDLGPGAPGLAVNWFSLDHRIAFWCLRGLLLFLLVCLAWLCRTPATSRRDWRLACEFSLIFIAMLLISERSWKHHFVTMVLPYAVLVAHLWRDSCDRKLRAYIWSSLTCAFLLMASTSSELGGWLVGGNGHKYAQAYGMFCASALVVLAAIAVVLARRRFSSSQSFSVAS